MGNSQSTFNSVHKVVATDYQLLGKNTTVRWGELFEMKNVKTNQMVFMQEKHARDLETHQRTIEACTYHISLNHKNLSSIYGFAGGETPDVFTNTYKLCVFFEHVVNSLSGVIKARRMPLHLTNGKNVQRFTQSFQYFDESELLRFMNQLVEVFDFLQRNGINQGDITPDVCFLSKDGVLKVLDRKLIYNDISSFDQAEQGSSNVFLTPTELGALANEKSKPSENRYKADVFRLGMTLLECATLQRSSDIYDWNTYTVNLDVLSSRLIEVKERYSSAFYDPVREMLRFEEEKRPDFSVLNQHLQEEAAQNFAMNMQAYKDEEVDMRKSVFGMGPKLITNFPSRPGNNQSAQSSLSYGPPQEGRRGSLTYQQAPNESFENKRQKSAMTRVKKDEDIDDTTELEADMKVNKVPFTETRNSVGPMESPAKRLQKMITDKHGIPDETRGASPGVNGRNTPNATPRQRFSLSLKDFFRRDSPTKGSAKKEANDQQQNNNRTQKPASPETFGSIPSSNRQHRRVVSGAPDFSYQSNFLSQSALNPPRGRQQADPSGDSPSHQVFDLRTKPAYTSGTRHTRSPTAQLPSKDFFSQYVNRQPFAYETPRQAENVTSSDYYYSVPSNPITQRTIVTNRPSYHAANASDSFVNMGDNGEVGMPNEHLDNVNVSIDEQRPARLSSQTNTKNVMNQSTKEEVSKRAPLLDQEPKPEEQQDIVEAILRRVLNSAGISPKKKLQDMSTETRLPIGYAKPQSLIKPIQVEMNENIGRTSVSSKYDAENLKNAYSSVGNAYTKPILQAARDERKPRVKPLEDQFTQAIEPRSVVSPKFGLRGISVEGSKSFLGGENERRSYYDELRSNRGTVGIDRTRALGAEIGVSWEANSPPVRKSVLQQSYLDDPTGLKVEDRFELAMERSHRSKGYMRNLAEKLNKSGSRNTSMEPTARTSHGGDGMMFRSGYLSNNPNQVRLNS